MYYYIWCCALYARTSIHVLTYGTSLFVWPNTSVNATAWYWRKLQVCSSKSSLDTSVGSSDHDSLLAEFHCHSQQELFISQLSVSYN